MRRGLQIFLTLLGAVAVVAGAATVALGVGSVPEHGEIVPSVDSEIRFYAVWYVAAGIAVLQAARRVEASAQTVRTVGAAFFVAGCARLVSVAVVGDPHPSQLVLLAVELALPLVLIPWQAAVARRYSAG